MERFGELVTDGNNELIEFLESEEASLPLEIINSSCEWRVGGHDNSKMLGSASKGGFNHSRFTPKMAKIQNYSKANLIMEVTEDDDPAN